MVQSLLFGICNFQKLEHFLSLVKQILSVSTRYTFRHAMEALVADGLLRHPDMDVKVSITSCISEIMRITAPDQPYKDSILKASTTHTVFFAQNGKSDLLQVFLLTKRFWYVIDSSDSVVFMHL